MSKTSPTSLLIIFILTLSVNLMGQNPFEIKNFRNIGPAGMSGRVTAIDVVNMDKSHIYIGTASGGVWESKNGGISWNPIFDDQNVLSIGSIKINQSNPDQIWVGTGEGNPRNSLNTGRGIYKSLDGGKTWKAMGLESTKVIHRIIIDRENPNIVYAGAMGSPWGPNKERGLYKTINGGESWEKILYVNDTTGVADMVVDPVNHDKLLVAMYQYLRHPYDFNSGGRGSGLYLTYDGGKNWKKLTSKEGLPKGNLGRIGLAISTSSPNIVYALIEAKKNGLYKSVDGGEHWTLVSNKNIGNRPFYYSEIYVDPINENRIYNLWSYVSLSEDGGKTFKTIMDYGNNIHPDHHAFWIDPDNPDHLMDGNDGGLNISFDHGRSWRFVTNLPVGQFYHVNYDMDWPYNVYGGMQDNGSWVGPSLSLKNKGITNSDFRELSFGDGFDVVPYPKDSRYGWSMSQGGSVGFYDRFTGLTKRVKPLHPEGKTLRFNWNAAIAQDPFNDCGVYFGSQYVHHTTDCGDSWTIISPDLTTNDTTKQHADKSGGLTIDATQAENYTTIVSIAPSTKDKNVIWVGTDDGNLQLTLDGGKRWNNLYKKLPHAPKNGWIPQIVVSDHDDKEVFVVINNYRQNDYTPYLYHTIDRGKSWRRIIDEGDVEGFVVSVVQDPISPNLIFAGTDAGLYVSYDHGKNWYHIDKNFPSVQVSDLKIHPREGDLIIGTFGRSLWILDDLRPLRKMADTNQKILDHDFAVFDVPDAYFAATYANDGSRFIAQGEFLGDNKSLNHAAIKVWTNPKTNPEDKDVKLKLQVVNTNGDTIRTKNVKVKPGLSVMRWWLCEDGVRMPSSSTPKKDDDLPGGILVLPGEYRIAISKGDSTLYTKVVVHNDPRIDSGYTGLKEKRKILKDFESTIQKAHDAYEILNQSRKNIANIKKISELQPDSIKTQIDSLTKIITQKVDSLERQYKMPSGLKGIQSDPNTLNSLLWRAKSYINNAWGNPGENALIAKKIAENKTDEVVARINHFVDQDWKAFVQSIDAFDLSLFKTLKTIKNE